LVFLISLAALVLAYLVNKGMLKILRENAVLLSAPVVEELLKTIPAYFLNRPVFHVHLLFGLGEGMYDFFTGKRESGKWAALVSVLSHSLFGALTLLILTYTGQVLLALAGAILAHCIWNYTIMRLFPK
jgi:hypothetical protein